MPLKIRELKAALLKAGFTQRPVKGSHSHWVHPDIPGTDGNDAQHYQLKQIRAALKKVGKTL